MSKNKQRTLVVTGASGHLGKLVIEQLLQKNHHDKIVAVTRSPNRLGSFANRGVTVIKGDFNDPHSLDVAFKNADRLLLISTNNLEVPGERIMQHRTAIEAAVRAGIKHVSYTSLPNPAPDSPMSIALDHFATEQILAATALNWTILRNNMYADVLFRRFPYVFATGELITAGGNGGVNYITREDCAKAAAASLISNKLRRETLDIVGTEVINYNQLAGIITEVCGQKIVNKEVSPEELRKHLLEINLPPFVADMFVSFDLTIAQGLLEVVSNDYKKLTGQNPEPLRDFLMRNRVPMRI